MFTLDCNNNFTPVSVLQELLLIFALRAIAAAHSHLEQPLNQTVPGLAPGFLGQDFPILEHATEIVS